MRVWNDAIALFVLACRVLMKFPYELKRVAANAIDAAHSVSRNIAEGYCRRSLKEYLNHLNFALGSCGEFHSCCISFLETEYITEKEYQELDEIQFRLENGLLKLIKSLQRKQEAGDWEDTFWQD